MGIVATRVEEEFLVEYILYRLNELVERDFDLININTNMSIKNNLDEQLQGIEKSIKEQMRKTNKLVELYSNEAININQFKLQNESISNTLDSLIKNKEVLEQQIRTIPQEKGSFKKDVQSVLSIPVEQWNNVMLKTIIKKIYINTNGIINVKWIIEG